ncbi:cingulin-like protein 1 isoform X2 [Trichomycterus rosablanca]|uniref:cingulin-like protein 1 isoform X2 n=1 Tax=Trichomycterus rosablanca TaxID=2290929 RepID=UPI002F35CF67
MNACRSSSGFEFVLQEKISDSAGSLRSLITQSHLRLLDLQRETQREISDVSQQLRSVRLQQEVLHCESADRQTLRTEAESLQRSLTSEIYTCSSGSERNLQRDAVVKAADAERLQFREQALVALLSMLGENIQRYQEESKKLDHLTEKLTNGMPGKSQLDSSMDYQFDQESEPLSPASEGPPTPKANQSPKYQMFLGSDLVGNGGSGPGGPTGSGSGANGSLSKPNQWKSMESLTSWDGRIGSADPPRVFNSPYSTISLDYNPTNRISEYKMPNSLSPNASEMNLFGLNRSTSPVSSNTLPGSRVRYSAYDSLAKRREQQAPPTHFFLRNNQPNKRDFIEELTRQLEECQRRNQFLEAESVELENERTQIRFEMRNLLVNNEDLLRMNTQLQGELKRMRDRIVELESDYNVMVERFKQLEVELKEAREVMVEANTQEYAFNFLQQSLKNKIQDAEETIDKQAQHNQELSEKLWLADRNLEELEIERDTKGKKTVKLITTVERLEIELAESLQQSSQMSSELSLQQKLRMDVQLRVEEMEECVLEKEQEVQRLQQIIGRLQGEVSDKLTDKERTLEDEIQLREKIQLQCKQAERAVEDLQMELQTVIQNRDDLSKQLKLTQETVIDLETDLEEMRENEQRLINKQKRAVEQSEQMQVKLIQEKDLTDKLEVEKVILERQVRELRSEIEELQNNKVQDHVVTKTEMRAKELENMLRIEERSKVVLNNTISKLERRINELTEQIEEEQKLAQEQKDAMNQRMRSLKRQLNEVEEEACRRESQFRYTQRELGEERESSSRLQKQLLDLQLQMKRKEAIIIRQKLEVSVSEDEEEVQEQVKIEKQEVKSTETSSTQN